MEIVYEGIRYEKIFSKELRVLGFVDNYTTKNLKIPPLVQNMAVSEIAENAFANELIETLSIPHNLMIIGPKAFSFCTNLTHAEVAFAWFDDEKNTLTLKDQAFSNCWNLKSFHFKGRTTSLCSLVFEDCFNLSDVDGAIQRMKESTFEGCASLHGIILRCSVIMPKNCLKGSAFKKFTFLGDAVMDKEVVQFIKNHNIQVCCSKKSNLMPLAYDGVFIECLEKQ